MRVKKIPLEEEQYLDLISKIFREGDTRNDRTGVGTLSVFGHSMVFHLSRGFPLLTTKKIPFKAVTEELLWFLSGDTDAHTLSKKGVKIWDANGSRETLDALGFHGRRVGDLGPVYGHQWRHYGADYIDADTNYTGKGIDQIAQLVEGLKTNPFSRRHIISAWNPSDISTMALPPCHVLCQFYVTTSKELHCHLYQRSADVGLGVPFNIASYSLLTCLLAHCCDLIPGKFHHTLGDAHIYVTHIDALRTQLCRQPLEFPTVHLNPDVKDIFSFTSQDIVLKHYEPHPHIYMEMAV